MGESLKNYTAVHLEKEGVIFEVDGETFWRSETQVVFPRYGIRGAKKETIATNWRNLLRDFPVIHKETRFSRILGRNVMELNPDSASLRHYGPIEKLRLLRRSEKHAFYPQINRLCGTLERIGMDANQLGIRGSLLVGQQNEFSDIDLLIYGHENKEVLFNNLKDFYGDPHINTILRNEAIARELYERRRSHFFGIGHRYFLLHERRRVQGLINNKTRFVFSIIGKAAEDASTKSITPICPATITGKVVDNSGAFYDPARMRLELRDLLADEKDSDVKDAVKSAREKGSVAVATYGDPICAVAFFPQDMVRIRGFLERAESTSGEKSYQVAIRPADDCMKQIKLIKDAGIRLW